MDTATVMEALDGELIPRSVADISTLLSKCMEEEVQYCWAMRAESQEFCGSQARVLRAYAGTITGDRQRPLANIDEVQAAGQRALKMLRPGGLPLLPERHRAELALFCDARRDDGTMTFLEYVTYFERRWEHEVSSSSVPRATTTVLATSPLSPRGGSQDLWLKPRHAEEDEDARVYIWEVGGEAQELEALRGVRVTQAAVGRNFAVATLANGEAVCWSKPSDGQLRGSPALMPFRPLSQKFEVARLSCAASHSGLLTAQGELFTWGTGVDGRLGHGSAEHLETPTHVEMLQGSSLRDVTCGPTTTFAIDEEGALYSCGSGSYGLTCHGRKSDVLYPRRCDCFVDTAVHSVSVGDSHGAAISRDGSLFTWGYGASGRLGLGHETDQPAPVAVGAPFEGGFWVAVACGTRHTAAIASDSKLHTCGAISTRCLGHTGGGDVMGLQEVQGCGDFVAVDCNASTTLGLTAEGTVVSLHGGLHTVVEGVPIEAIAAGPHGCVALAGRGVHRGARLDESAVQPREHTLPWFAPSLRHREHEENPYLPTPVAETDPYSQSAKPTLFSPEISRAKLVARESLLRPVLGNHHHHHLQEWPSYPPGAALESMASSYRSPATNTGPCEAGEKVTQALQNVYTRCGYPHTRSVGGSAAKAAALRGSVGHYDSEKVSAFSLAGDMQKRLDGLREERDVAQGDCEEQQRENDKIRARCQKLREENDQMASQLMDTAALQRSRRDEVLAMEEENKEMEDEVQYLKEQVRLAIDNAAEEGARHWGQRLA